MEVSNKVYLTAREVAEMIGCSVSNAYKMIREINAELAKQGYITVKGKVSRFYVEQHWYGLCRNGGAA